MRAVRNGDASRAGRSASAAERVPVREFMMVQTARTRSTRTSTLFAKLARENEAAGRHEGGNPDRRPIPAFIITELKTAFLMGFMIYLPFLMIDMVDRATLMQHGHDDAAAGLISLPFKILLFVLVDGWHLLREPMGALSRGWEPRGGKDARSRQSGSSRSLFTSSRRPGCTQGRVAS